MKVLGTLLFLLATTHVLSTTSTDHDDEGISGNISQVRCIERERHALLSFKQGLDDPSNLLASWTNGSKDSCAWRGIRCDNLTNHIIILDLGPICTYYFSIQGGQIGPSLVQLQHLEHLDLSYCGVTKIPEFIGAFTRLRFFNLSHNSIVGNIPSQLRNLTRLRILDLGGFNNMTAKGFEWLSHLPHLRFFRLSHTNFAEATDWFRSFKTAPSLSTIMLYSCEFPQHEASPLSHINSSNSLTTLEVTWCGLEPGTSSRSRLLNLSNNLVDLKIVRNYPIGGPIPNSFENLKSLRLVDLSRNWFEGGMPKSMRNILCNLQKLDLSGNRFNESLHDSLESATGCSNNSLEFLDLSKNELGGSFFDVENFPNSLRVLRIRENKVSGPLPDISKTSYLRELDVSYNELNGSLPEGIGKLSNLEFFDVSNNKLNGSLPEGIGQLSNLEFFDVSVNSFSGVISEAHFLKLSKLRLLDLSSNSHLSLKLEFNRVPPFQLEYVNLRSCVLGPQFPSWLQTQSNIYFLDLSSSEISNPIPNWFPNILSSQSYYYLNLSFNLINGTLPNFPVNTDSFPFIDLSSNQFHGSIPLFLFNASLLNLSNNSLTRFGPLFCTILDAKIEILDLSNNLLFGSLPDCWFHLNNLNFLNLDNNKLSGMIPRSMASLYYITALKLGHNNFSGKLSTSLIKNCTQLKYLDVGVNNLEGSIPTWIGERLTNLAVLQLKSNKFQGTIPSNLCHLQSIIILEISQNNISGVIPSCINNLTYMVDKVGEEPSLSSHTLARYASRITAYDYKALVTWKGKEYEYKNILRLLRVIDLSSNRLIGEIPKELINLDGLRQLNLSRNNLSGAILDKIGNLSDLESLDLSHNNLSGEISNDLAKIFTLDYLDLSYNHLSGRIPTSTQLQSLNASSFVGNIGLCGLPLSTTCPGDRTSQDPDPNNVSDDEENQDENDSKWFDMSWFYMGLGVVINI